jgi:GTPase involved in cell partitioning and DNA repair
MCPGTIVKDFETGDVLADMTTPGERIVLLKGAGEATRDSPPRRTRPRNSLSRESPARSAS